MERWWKRAWKMAKTNEAGCKNNEWLTNRHQFLWQRLRLWLWLVLLCLLSFTVRDIYSFFVPLKEFADLPETLRTQRLCINLAMLLFIVVCFALHKTQFGRRHPGLLFLGSSWSISLSAQLFATVKGFALPDLLGWALLFLSQATFIPVYWELHLISQVGLLVYYFGVNTALGLKTPIPEHPDLYNVSLILYVFWLCAICDFGVYLYDRLQRSEFFARKELESAYKKLEATEAKYRSIFENAQEGIFQTTVEGRYITVNPALASILGYAKPEEVIANFTNIAQQLYVDTHRRAEFIRLIEKYDTVSEFESQVYRRDGSIVWICEKAYAVRDEQGNLLYYEGLIEDITQRKQAEAALRVFFHAVSHDLRNPVLGTLMVLKNLLQREGMGNGEVGKTFSPSIPVPSSILERMVQSSDRQLNLINSLLEAHTNEVQGVVLQCQRVKLSEVVEAAIADLQPMLAQNQAHLTNLVSADLPLVNGDFTQLWRVFSNLIVNAVKHNPPGLELTLNATLEKEKIYCTVSDNGIGISPEQSARLFDLYFRASNSRSSVSLGLGLYLCKQIINAHGGDIGVNSKLADGATFWFTLPVKIIDN